MRAAPSLALALLMLSVTGYYAAAPTPLVAIPDAATQTGPIAVVGLATNVREGPSGWRFQLHGDGAMLEAFSAAPVTAGWLRAEGRIRPDVHPLLLVSRATQANLTSPQPTWDDVARNPEWWRHRAVTLDGTVQGGTLRDGAGHKVMLGEGEWPKTGAVRATGTLRYDPMCLCDRFDAGTVGAMP